MKSGKNILIVVLVAALVGLFFFMKSEGIIGNKKGEQMQIQLNQLKGVAKLVIWEQDFTLNATSTLERTYIGIFKSKESIKSTINGRMGFHIDLADSVNTHFIRKGDSIIIQTPLHNTYIQLDLASLNQTKEASLDPTLELKKEEVIKKLQQKVLDEYVPTLQSRLSQKDLKYQEEKLSQLVNAPVRIVITKYPDKNQFNWKSVLN